MIIDNELLDKVAEQAKASPRLRMNWIYEYKVMKEIVKGVWLMRLCLFVVMIRTRDRREGTSRVMT